MSRAVFKILGHASPESAQARLSVGVVKDGAIIIASKLGAEATVNDHLVWLWGLLQHERRVLKSLQAEGAKMLCLVQGHRGRVTLLPNGAEMLHLLNAELHIEAT